MTFNDKVPNPAKFVLDRDLAPSLISNQFFKKDF